MRPYVDTNLEDGSAPKRMGTGRAIGKDSAPINPILKSWIDEVIVPALMQEWRRSQVPTMAA